MTYTYGQKTKQVKNRHARIPPLFAVGWPLGIIGVKELDFNADWLMRLPGQQKEPIGLLGI